MTRVMLWSLCLVGCGGVSVARNEGAGGSGGESHGLPSGAGGTAGGSDSGVNGSPQIERLHAESCVQTRDALTLDARPTGQLDGLVRCVETEHTFEGIVTLADDETFQVDTCPDTTDCASRMYTVTVHGPDLKASQLVPIGASVHVHHWTGCTTMVVSSLYVGSSKGGPFFFYGEEGGAPLEDAPYVTERLLLDCAVEPSSASCADPPTLGLYAFRFTMKSSLESAIGYMGQPVAVMLDHGAVEFHDVRSLQTQFCDHDWSHWARSFVPLR